MALTFAADKAIEPLVPTHGLEKPTVQVVTVPALMLAGLQAKLLIDGGAARSMEVVRDTPASVAVNVAVLSAGMTDAAAVNVAEV